MFLNKSIATKSCLVALLMVVFLSCSSNKSGVAPTQGSGNTFGYLYNQDGSPAKGAHVNIVPADFVPQQALSKKTAAATIDSGITTDQNGRFSVNNISLGTYNVFGAGSGVASYASSVTINEASNTVAIAIDTLKTPGNITGVVQLAPQGDSRRVLIMVIGSYMLTTPIDSVGDFALNNLAPGSYLIRFLALDTQYPVLDTTFTVVSGKTTNIGNIILSKMIASVGTVTDTDGNVYQTVRIGNQIWTVENLRVTRFNDGSSIPLDTSTVTWNNDSTPKYCFYNNTTNADSIKKYGALYNWYVVDTKKLAPAGWHVPTEPEWEVMQSYLEMHGYNYAGTVVSNTGYIDTSNNKIAKALAAQTDWDSSTVAGTPGNNLTKNNSSGFSALPGGYRNIDGSFILLGDFGNWWSATEDDASYVWGCDLGSGGDGLSPDIGSGRDLGFGFSVRLVKD